MNNRFEALKVFCSLAETLQFKETASRLAVSPPVVSRVIAELEAWLGEPLFQRNTRQVNLTEFGQQFLPRKPVCISNEISTQLQIARAGKAAVLLLDWLCRPYLDSGELVELLPDLARTAWPVYVYRPQRTVTPLRVNVVFDTLAKLLQERLPAITSGFH